MGGRIIGCIFTGIIHNTAAPETTDIDDKRIIGVVS
jgi:hypothetical protein